MCERLIPLDLLPTGQHNPRSSRAAVFADPDLGEDSVRIPTPDRCPRRRASESLARFTNSTSARGRGRKSNEFLNAAPRSSRCSTSRGHGAGERRVRRSRPKRKPIPSVDAEQISSLDLSRLKLAVLAGMLDGSWAPTVARLTQTPSFADFLDAGATRVLAANWDTDSFASRPDSMETFYDELLRGHHCGMRTARAMLAVRADPRTAHPSAWAAFQLYGEPDTNRNKPTNTIGKGNMPEAGYTEIIRRFPRTYSASGRQEWIPRHPH